MTPTQKEGAETAGRIETGIVKPGDEVEVVGIKPGTKTSVTGAAACRLHRSHSIRIPAPVSA